MKKILFAMMAIAVVVLTTGCNKNEDFLKASLSVEEVIEHSIKVHSAYIPTKKEDAGYLLLRSTTDRIDDEMRKELVELYKCRTVCIENTHLRLHPRRIRRFFILIN